IAAEEQLAYAADDAITHAAARFLDDCVQAILRPEALAYIGRSQADPADRPWTAGERERIIGVHRLMCPMKRADAQMDDADRQRGAVVTRLHDRAWQYRQR